MIRRLLLTIVFALTPLVALADDATPTPTPDPTSASQQGSSGDSSLLGPQTGASSTAASGTLQPAGNDPLQSGTDNNQNLSAPTGSNLQGSVPSGDTSIVLGTEADGERHNVASADTTSSTVLDTAAVVALLALMGLVAGLRQRTIRRFGH